MYVYIFMCFFRIITRFIYLRLFIVWYHCELHSVSSPFFCIYPIIADIQVGILGKSVFVISGEESFRFSIHNTAFYLLSFITESEREVNGMIK